MNLYEILHVSQDAPEEIIKLAYKGLAQKYHPDRYKGNDANEIMVKIREAYETLIDPIKRKNYDQFLAAQAQRKRQQEEDIKKKEQEEFIRAQKAAFEQKDQTGFSTQAKQKTQDSDSKSFKMNISIDVPNSFSIFSPFIKLKNWIITKKKVFLQIGSTFIALALILTLAIAATSYMNNLSVKTDEATMTAADEAVTAADEAIAAAEELDAILNDSEEAIDTEAQVKEIDSNAYNSELDNNIYNSVEVVERSEDTALAQDEFLIKTSVKKLDAVMALSGLIGVKEEIKTCYADINSNKKYCFYLDYSARIFDANVSHGMNAEPNEFFAEELFLERTFVNYYLPMNITDMNQINKHLMDSYNEILPILHQQFTQ